MSDKVWFKIGETAAIVGATPKELRYWEKVIPDLRPRRSKGNLRYYHLEELARLQRIRQWLAEGLTVADCCELLRGQPPQGRVPPKPREGVAPAGLQTALSALRALHRRLGGAPNEVAPAQAIPETPKPPRPRRTRPVPSSPAVPPASTESILLEAEPDPQEASIPEPPAPQRTRKAKAEASVLGRMWSEGRLPLDWEE